MGLLVLLIPLALLWLLVIRPQQRRMKDQQMTVSAASFGDEIVTAGGFIGTIVAVHDPDDPDEALDIDEIVVELADGIEVHMLRRGIAQIRSAWDGEYDDGSIDEAYTAGALGEASVDGPIENPAEAPDSPVDGD